MQKDKVRFVIVTMTSCQKENKHWSAERNIGTYSKRFCNNDRSPKTEQTLICGKKYRYIQQAVFVCAYFFGENISTYSKRCSRKDRHIQQAVFADVLVLGEVASLRCVSCDICFLSQYVRQDTSPTVFLPIQHRPSA